MVPSEARSEQYCHNTCINLAEKTDLTSGENHEEQAETCRNHAAVDILSITHKLGSEDEAEMDIC